MLLKFTHIFCSLLLYRVKCQFCLIWQW